MKKASAGDHSSLVPDLEREIERVTLKAKRLSRMWKSQHYGGVRTAGQQAGG